MIKHHDKLALCYINPPKLVMIKYRDNIEVILRILVNINHK